MSKYLVFLGGCTWQCSLFPGRLVALSVAGNFELSEANQYILHLLDHPFVHWDQFLSEVVQVHFLYFYANPEDEVLEHIQPYLDYFSVADYVDTQEWLHARVELDYLIRGYAGPGTSGVIVGSLLQNSYLHLDRQE